MFGLFKTDPTKKLAQQISKKRAESVHIQRSGDLRAYAAMISEIERMEDELVALREGTTG